MPIPHLFVNETGFIKRDFLDDNFSSIPEPLAFLGDKTGVSDVTLLFQTAINIGSVSFSSGVYKMSGDVQIPSNRKIHVKKGATITNTGGRFTSDTQVNIEWQIDGIVKSVAMAIAPSKPLWTGLVGDRGFIEFGSNYVAGQAGSGFWVHGNGIVSGDWVGTPNYADPVNQTNRKGIASWNAQNVLVEGLEVFGFDGEAVYSAFFDIASKNIVFRNNNIHDTRFNALNFNSGANGGGCKIHHNQVKNVFAVELSSGECTDNHVESTISMGIWTGVGAGAGPISISRNTIVSCGTVAGAYGIAAVFAAGTPVTGVEIDDNVIVNSYSYSIYTDYIREFSIRGNKCVGTGQVQGSYDIGLNHALRGSVSENTFMSPGGAAQVGRIAVDVATCFDVAITPDTNVYIPTTGAALPGVGNGVQTIASIAALPIPILGRIFTISGVTTITSIVSAAFSSANAGRQITLIFQGILTVTDGANLKLAGNFVTTADDTMTLICDGTNWYEVARSVN